MNNNNKSLALVLIVIVGVIAYLGYHKNNTQSTATVNSIKNATYKIVGENVTLKNGIESHASAPGSASQTVTNISVMK